MINVIFTHNVKDFSVWKKLFDADEPRRAAAGLKTTGVYTSVDNPNQATVTVDFPSIEVVQGFLEDPELKVKMEEAGVLSMPEIKILNKVY